MAPAHRGAGLAAGVVAGAVVLPVVGCGAEQASPHPPARAGEDAVAAGGLRVRLTTVGQRTALARRRMAVALSSRRAATVRIGVQAIEHVPGRGPGPLRPLTATRAVALAADRPVAVSLPLTGRGRRALATCARYRFRVVVRAGGARPAVAATGAERQDPGRCARPFAPSSFWNTPLAADAPIDPQSDAMVAALRTDVDAAEARGFGPTMNTASYSTPVEEVAENQPRVRVTLDDPATYRARVRAALRSVPLPADARPAAGTDAHLVVWQPSTDTMWEFWKLRRASDGWHARAAGRMRRVSRSAGVFPSLAGATATSLPLLGGLVRPEELARGRIDHVLALAIPHPRAGVWTAPAQRTDGFVREADALPEGARLRLDPSIDVDALGLPPAVRMLAHAAQRYGMVVRDTAATVALYAEAPTPRRRISYRRYFGDEPVFRALPQFPWQHLQVLRMHLTTYRGAPTS